MPDFLMIILIIFQPWYAEKIGKDHLEIIIPYESYEECKKDKNGGVFVDLKREHKSYTITCKDFTRQEIIMFDKYFKMQQDIFDYFGYVEDWVNIPLVDHREYYWHYAEGGSIISYSEKFLTTQIVEAGNEYYEASIYTQQFLPKWIYRADDFTLVCMDTHCDGNKFLGIFSNNKEVTEIVDSRTIAQPM